MCVRACVRACVCAIRRSVANRRQLAPEQQETQGEEIMRKLAQKCGAAFHAREVVDLRLAKTRIDQKMLVSLGRALRDPNGCSLVSLSLADNAIRPVGWRAFLQGLRSCTSLRRLDLSRCGCFAGPRGTSAFEKLLELVCKSETPNKGITELVLRGNHLTSTRHFAALQGSVLDRQCRLAALDLSYNLIKNEGLAAIFLRSSRDRRFVVAALYLVSQGFSTADDFFLPSWHRTTAASLISLRLRGCGLSSAANSESSIAACLPSRLVEFDLSENNINDAEVAQICRVLQQRLSTLSQRVRSIC